MSGFKFEFEFRFKFSPKLQLQRHERNLGSCEPLGTPHFGLAGTTSLVHYGERVRNRLAKTAVTCDSLTALSCMPSFVRRFSSSGLELITRSRILNCFRRDAP